LSYKGRMMTLARWPNIDAKQHPHNSKWNWEHVNGLSGEDDTGFSMNTTQNPDLAKRILSWKNGSDAYVHGYWQFDWADCYRKIKNISGDGDMVRLELEGSGNYVHTKPNARWMAVNVLQELDHPEEYYIDVEKGLLYFYPPEPLTKDSPDVVLMYKKDSVVNIGSAVKNSTLSRLYVANGRHTGISAENVEGLTIRDVIVSAFGSNGIVLHGKRSSISNVSVHDVGCTAIQAKGGNVNSLLPGNILVENTTTYRFAQWKRTYMPGISFGGVHNIYRNNIVSFGPHNCFHGGGNDGWSAANCTFEGNILSDCTFETADTGAFYTCGQQATAFTNRGNVLRNNVFVRAR